MATILVVDDSGVMRKKLTMLFTEAGHSVVAEAQSGFEAIKAYARHKPDLVTMDIMMPGMTGIEAVKKIIPAFPDARILMISSLAQKDMIMDALKSGAKNFLVKPFSAQDAKNMVDKILSDFG